MDCKLMLMSYLKYIEREERLMKLVELECTGSTEKVGKLLGVTSRTIKRMISSLRDRGVNIEFCRIKNSYIYVE